MTVSRVKRLAWRLWPEMRPVPKLAGDQVHYITPKQLARAMNRAGLAFLFMGVMFTVVLGLFFSTRSAGIKNQRDGVYATCMAGTELRLATADGIDKLRASVQSLVPVDFRGQFLRITQPGIDALLTQAAGRPYRAPVPPGSITEKVRAEVTGYSVVRCTVRAKKQTPNP